MTKAAIDALRTEHGRALDLARSLSTDEWSTPSACDGWRVQDVYAHMAATFRVLSGDSSIPSDPSGDAERSAELAVAPRKEWSPDEVLAEYVEWSEKGIGALAALQDPPMADAVVPLGNLGSHPMHILGNAIVFDHYCHLRHDIGAAVPRAAELPHDEAALSATVEWMLAGLPQMCAGALAGCSQGINLVIDGPAAGAWIIAPGAAIWTVTAGTDPSLPAVRTTAHDFVAWGTKRVDWRLAGVSLEGPDTDAAATTLDAINVI